MKYFPVFKRKINVARNNVTTEEIANMMSKIDLIHVMRIENDCVKCRRTSFGKNNIVPDVDVFPMKTDNTTQLHCVFHLRKEVQILFYIYSILAVAVQIGVLITFWDELTLPCFAPIGIIVISHILTYLLLLDETGVIIDTIKSKKHLLEKENYSLFR